jgi:hypothetical protein
MDACRQHTVKLSDQGLDLPQKPPYMMEHNLWVANAPGSTLLGRRPGGADHRRGGDRQVTSGATLP